MDTKTLIIIVVVVFFLGKGDQLLTWVTDNLFTSEHPALSEGPAILVANRPELLSPSYNVTEFTVGEPLYFRLHITGDLPETLFWRLHDHYIQQGIDFKTSDLKLDLEALERSSIPGGFRIEAYFRRGKDEIVRKVIRFREKESDERVIAPSTVSPRYPLSMERNKQYEPPGSLSYKGDEIMVMGKNGPIICTINPKRHLVSECPE